VLTFDQLRALGLGARAVQRRAKSGRLHRIHRGVYALTPASLLPRHGRWLAAVLACGPDAVLSHRTAAALHDLRPTSGAIDVTVPVGSAGRRAGIRLHRAKNLDPTELTIVERIPCTGVSRTLLDLAGVLTRRQLERTLDEVETIEAKDRIPLSTLLEHHPYAKGASTLKAILTEHRAGSTVTESEFEEPFLALVRQAGLPQPEVGYYIDPHDGGLLVKGDFVWVEQRLVVETDGHRFHGTRAAFESDRRRDQRLTAAGWRVIRITWRQLTERPHEVIGLLVELL